MPVKVSLTKPEYDALAEPVRALYVEKEGKYLLDGAVSVSEVDELKTKLGEFRDNNRTMHTELEKLRPLQEKFKDVDPIEYQRLKTEAEKLAGKGVKTSEDVQAAINAAIKPIADKLDATEKAREAAQREADDSRFTTLVTADAIKAGVKPSGIRHVIREARDVFTLEGGALKPKQGVKHPTDPSKDLTSTEWLQHLSTTDDYLFGESVGGGANGGRERGPKPGVKELLNPTPEEMGRHMDALAKGEMVVRRT